MEFQGEPIHGEVDSSDASGGIAFTLYPLGYTTARTLASNEYLVITDIMAGNAAAGVVAIYADADADGKRVFKMTLPVTSQVTHHFETPFVCAPGVVPKFVAPAGVATCTINGSITKTGT